MGSVFREPVGDSSAPAAEAPCGGGGKHEPASVCLGEIDGLLGDAQTEPGLIPLSLPPVANCEKQGHLSGCLRP